MNDDRPLLNLLLVFAPLSLLAIGGGNSVLADMQRAVVFAHGWLSSKEFQEIFAVSRVSPGPGMLIATLIGWHVAGWQGALVTTLAIVIPSSTLIYGLAHVWHSGPPKKWQRALSRGLAPIAASLILASTFHLLQNAEGQIYASLTAIGVAGLAQFTRIGHMLLLVIGVIVFVAFQFAAGGINW